MQNATLKPIETVARQLSFSVRVDDAATRND
jgi:hypothetical protein